MLSFSVNGNVSMLYANKVWKTIQENKNYFKKFNNANWQEAIQKAYFCALEKEDTSYDDLTPYIKKLARTVLCTKKTEIVSSIFTEDGEVSPVYYSLTESIDTDSINAEKEVKDIFKELYLIDSEEFLKLQNIFTCDDAEDLSKAIKIKNEELYTGIYKLINKYNSQYVIRNLYDFFKELPTLVSVRVTHSTKEVNLRKSNYKVLGRIPTTPLIKGVEDGLVHRINKETLTMDKNPDYFKWDIVGNTICNVLRIDMSSLFDYMYNEVYVEEGVNTKHITWCGDKYRLTTPGGETMIGADREKFLSFVRIELILNLLANNINTLVALSQDNMYIKPTRAFQYDTIRVKTVTGKTFDLPVTVHIKRKK